MAGTEAIHFHGYTTSRSAMSATAVSTGHHRTSRDAGIAPAGALDPTFGNVGRVVTDFTDLGGSYDEARAVVTQADGRAVVGGSAYLDTGELVGFVARYNPDGTLDATFGIGGRVTTRRLSGITDLAVLPDGSILATGQTFGPGFSYDFGVIKLDGGGSPVVANFGTRGLASADFAGFDDAPNALTVLAGGGFLVAGRAYNGSSYDFAVARFDATGVLDNTFDNDGKQTVDFAGFDDVAYDLAVDSTNRILLVGSARTFTNDLDFALARLGTAGMLDATFGSNGKLTTDFGQQRDDEAFSVALQPGGFIVAGGYATLQKQGRATADEDFALARYDSSGDFAGFGGGRVTTDFTRNTNDPSYDRIGQIRPQADGKVVAAGRSWENGFSYRRDVALARFDDVTGAIDTGLAPNTSGKLYANFYGYSQNAANALAIQGDGKWVVAGLTGDFRTNVALARFEEPAPPTVTLSLTGSPFAENGGVAAVTATLSVASIEGVTVSLGFSGVASAGGDYIASASTILIPAGQTSGSITLTGRDDQQPEASESVVVDISSVTNGTESGAQQVTATIADDDSPPSVTLGLSGGPMSEAGGTATVTATLSAASGRDVTVDLGFAGTASNPGDYARSGATITIAAGSTSGSVTLTAAPDALDEADETVVVDISSVTNGTESGAQQVTATIADDDLPSVSLSLTGSPFAENGGVATVTATLSIPSFQNVTVNLGFSGSAAIGSDYAASASTIIVPAGQTSASVTLTGIDDVQPEASESVLVAITGVTNGAANGTQQVTATITNNEKPTTSTPSPVHLSVASFNQKVGKKVFRFIRVISSAGGTPRLIRSPLQAPTYKNIKVIAMDTNGDGSDDSVQVSGKKGKKTRVVSIPM